MQIKSDIHCFIYLLRSYKSLSFGLLLFRLVGLLGFRLDRLAGFRLLRFLSFMLDSFKTLKYFNNIPYFLKPFY